MTKFPVLALCAAALLSACSSPIPQEQFGADGRPLPRVYKMSKADEAEIPYRVLDSLNTLRQARGAPPVVLNAALNAAAGRVSFTFGFRGPCMAIDTACSSSLVAFHQACQAILSGDVDQAVTGGISLHMHPFGFMIFAKATMLSRTGRCQSFDENGDGYARSEGGGLFLLKDYDQAVADGNTILAVVAASAVNTDGRKSSLTLPNAEAQAALARNRRSPRK